MTHRHALRYNASYTFLFFMLLVGAVLIPAGAQTVTIGDAEFAVERVGGAEVPGPSNDPGDFTQPVYLTQAPNDGNNLYIIERTEADNLIGEAGRVVRFDLQTNTSSTYLDLIGSFVWEGGILSMAFHPEFEENGLLYVVANFDSGGGIQNRLLEFCDDGFGSPVLQRTLFEYSPLGDNYQTIGWVGFQPGDEENRLYLTTGDGGTQASDPEFAPELIEHPDSPYGKLLRFNLDVEYPTPATDTTHSGIEVVSLGFRNPYRGSFSEDGGLFVGDVGYTAVEEINYISAAQIASATVEDFGWTSREGSIETQNSSAGGPKGPNDIDPVFDYLHPDVDAGIVGYGGDTSIRGNSISSGYLFQGRLFFGDFITGAVYSGAWDGMALTDIVDHTLELEDELDSDISRVVSFSRDNAGNLYILDFGNDFFSEAASGDVFRLLARSNSGDYNSDGNVDLADYTVWRNTLGATGIGLAADGDGSGTVDSADYRVWRNSFGKTLPAPDASHTTVPEPSTWTLFSLLSLAITCNCRMARLSSARDFCPR